MTIPNTRRIFILSTIVAGTALFLLPQGAKSPITIEPFKVMAAVQEILFPKHGNAPSASEFGATNYLINVSTHSSFWAEDLAFLHRGAYQLIETEPDFLKLSTKEQNEAIENFSETKMGKNWLSLLLFYTLEALLSDPIYGGNREEMGWRWLGHRAGEPRPQKPFGELL